VSLTDLIIVGIVTGFSALCAEYAKDLKKFIGAKIRSFHKKVT
jgi:hypothetical protein